MNILNIIHLFRRDDRYQSLRSELVKQNITDYKLWEGIEEKHNRKLGIHQAHNKIVQDAKDNNLERVFIAEDDIYWFAEGAWQYYLDNIPEQFDIYFAMIMVGEIDNRNRLISQGSGMTCYCVHNRFYDTFLAINPDSHIDREITSQWEKYEFYTPPKFVCSQIGGKSDNTMKAGNDYKPLLENRKLFGRD